MRILTIYRTYAGRAFMALAASAGLCVLLYIAFLFGAIAHAAAESEAAAEGKALSVEIGALEADYLALGRTLSPERAAELGFVHPAEEWVVYATGPQGLTLR